MTSSKIQERYRQLACEAVECCSPYPEDEFTGTGIVICGGGTKYFPSAWVCINMLRLWNCQLPIELWHLGPAEVDDDMRRILEPLGTACVDAFHVRKQHPMHRLGGFELKPYAIAYSRFEEVLLLDADNVPLFNPEAILTWPEYHETGSLFWPDYSPLSHHNEIWSVCDIPFRFEPSFESGQILINKRSCWLALQLTLHYNEHSDFYYRFLGGDKDTFHLAWRKLGLDYAMTSYSVRDLGRRVMLQHDFEGRIIFQHRNLAKWKLPPESNLRIDGFQREGQCLNYLDRLNEQWSGVVQVHKPVSEAAKRMVETIGMERFFVYERVGYDRRVLELCPEQTIGKGCAALETNWHVVETEDEGLQLHIYGGTSLTCRLNPQPHGWYSGRWVIHERMPVILSPLNHLSEGDRESLELDEAKDEMTERWFCLVHVGKSAHFIRLQREGQVETAGGGGIARWDLIRQSHLVYLAIVTQHRNWMLTRREDLVWRSGLGESGELVELVPLPRSICGEQSPVSDG